MILFFDSVTNPILLSLKMFESMLLKNERSVVVVVPVIGIGSTNGLDRKKEVSRHFFYFFTFEMH